MTKKQISGSTLRRMQYHWLGKDQFCSGAAFVPRVGGSHEDDGWIISFIHNEKTKTSQASFYCCIHINPPSIKVRQQVSTSIFMFLCCRCILSMLKNLKMLLLQKYHCHEEYLMASMQLSSIDNQSCDGTIWILF